MNVARILDTAERHLRANDVKGTELSIKLFSHELELLTTRLQKLQYKLGKSKGEIKCTGRSECITKKESRNNNNSNDFPSKILKCTKKEAGKDNLHSGKCVSEAFKPGQYAAEEDRHMGVNRVVGRTGTDSPSLPAHKAHKAGTFPGLHVNEDEKKCSSSGGKANSTSPRKALHLGSASTSASMDFTLMNDIEQGNPGYIKHVAPSPEGTSVTTRSDDGIQTKLLSKNEATRSLITVDKFLSAEECNDILKSLRYTPNQTRNMKEYTCITGLDDSMELQCKSLFQRLRPFVTSLDTKLENGVLMQFREYVGSVKGEGYLPVLDWDQQLHRESEYEIKVILKGAEDSRLDLNLGRRYKCDTGTLMMSKKTDVCSLDATLLSEEQNPVHILSLFI